MCYKYLKTQQPDSSDSVYIPASSCHSYHVILLLKIFLPGHQLVQLVDIHGFTVPIHGRTLAACASKNTAFVLPAVRRGSVGTTGDGTAEEYVLVVW